MDQYPVSDELNSAIRTLFDDPFVALGFLGFEGNGDDSSDDWREAPTRTTATADERARSLTQKLETYIVNMAAELDELGTDELQRLRAEATGFLISLREIVAHFPGAFFPDQQ